MPEWKPQEDIIITLSDETAEERSEEVLDEMVKEISEVANKYGFSWSSYGGQKSYSKTSITQTIDLLKEALFERVDGNEDQDIETTSDLPMKIVEGSNSECVATRMNLFDIIEFKDGKVHQITWQEKYFRTRKRFVFINPEDLLPYESNVQTTNMEDWTPCEKLPF